MGSRAIWPGYAYIPGKTPRHPEGTFDTVRETANPGASAAELASSDAFKLGLSYLDAGFFWEAHEVLEPVWLILPKDSDERRLVQTLIQLANGLLKLQMERPKAALRLAQIAGDLLEGISEGSLMTVRMEDVRVKIDSLKKLAKDAI